MTEPKERGTATPEERADWIIEGHAEAHGLTDQLELKRRIIEQIKQAIAGAVEQAREESAAVKCYCLAPNTHVDVRCGGCHGLVYPCNMEDFEKGFSAAQAQAAKIARNGPPAGGIVHCDGDVRDPGVVATGFQKWIAQKIEAMKPEAERCKHDVDGADCFKCFPPDAEGAS